MSYERDPLSVQFDAQARRLLERVQVRPQTWVGIRLVDPDMRTRTQAAARGINLDAPDNPSAQGGRSRRTDAKTRLARAFVRSVYWNWRWWSNPGGTWRTTRRTTPRATGGLRFEVGNHLPASPQFDPANPGAGGFPPGRAVRFMLDKGGAAKLRAVQRLPDSQRIYDDAGGEAGRWSDPNQRDWG